jgi:hypothetical protein
METCHCCNRSVRPSSCGQIPPDVADLRMQEGLQFIGFELCPEIPVSNPELDSSVRFLRSRNSSVNIVTRLRAGHPSSHGSIYKIYGFFFSPNRSAALGPTRGCCAVGEGICVYKLKFTLNRGVEVYLYSSFNLGVR